VNNEIVRGEVIKRAKMMNNRGMTKWRSAGMIDAERENYEIEVRERRRGRL
jgi:hypothetical protein